MSRDVLAKETIEDLTEAIAYIGAHPEIDNVLLSGGDPMVSSTRRLANLFARLASIPHIWQIRISSKLPAFLPARFTTDPEGNAASGGSTSALQWFCEALSLHPHPFRRQTGTRGYPSRFPNAASHQMAAGTTGAR
jgi:L-lysine 2,3-aminomutase